MTDRTREQDDAQSTSEPGPDPWAPPPEGAQAGQQQAPAPRPAPQTPRPSEAPAPPTRRPPGFGVRPTAPAGSSSTGSYALLLAVLGLLAFRDAWLGVVFGVGAVVLGVWGLVEVRRTRGVATSAIAGLALGAIVFVFAVLQLVASLVPAERDYRNCLDGALTHSAVQACTKQLSSSGGAWELRRG